MTGVQQLIIKAVERGGRVFHHCYLPDVLALMSVGKLPEVNAAFANGDGTHTLVIKPEAAGA